MSSSGRYTRVMLLCLQIEHPLHTHRGLGSGLSLTGLGGLGCWWWVLEESVEVAGEVPFQAASGFSGGFSEVPPISWSVGYVFWWVFS